MALLSAALVRCSELVILAVWAKVLHLRTCRLPFLLLMAEILHQLIGSFSYYLQGFMPPRWCRISAINSISEINEVENWKTRSLRMGRGGHHVSTAVSVDTIGTTGSTPSCPKGKSLGWKCGCCFFNISLAGPWVNFWQSYDDIIWWVFMNFIPPNIKPPPTAVICTSFWGLRWFGYHIVNQ